MSKSPKKSEDKISLETKDKDKFKVKKNYSKKNKIKKNILSGIAVCYVYF